VYDVFILGLMIVGISTAVVFSYKIFHSRVYPVGMVRRKISVSPEDVDVFESGLETDVMDYLARETSSRKIADLHLSKQNVKDWRVYAKRRLGPKSHYKFPLRYLQTASLEQEDSALEEEVVEHGEALKYHSKQLEEIEERIRRLEIESVQKLQEATEEKPQPPRVVN